MVFSNLWAGRAVKTTLAPKFGDLAERWGRAGLGKGGTRWNLWPPFPPTYPPPPLAVAGGATCQAVWPSLLPWHVAGAPWPPPSQGQGEGRRKEGRRGGGVSVGEGGLRGGGTWVGSMHHPLPWLPPQTSSKIGSF
jgi:hypothetical protein